MKHLTALNNVQRATLLFDLFPSEREPFIDFIVVVANHLQQEKAALHTQWDNPLFSLNDWITFANEAVASIKRDRKVLLKSSQSLANHLFGGLVALFCAHCVQQYIQHEIPRNERFKDAANLLF